MQVKVKDIIVKNRIRKNLGDLSGLMESISKFGLMNPIVINSKNELIAGHRRLESCKRLGIETVQVRVISEKDEATKIEMEIDENLHRKNLSPEEIADGYLRLEHIRRPNLFRKIGRWFSTIFHRFFSKPKRNRDFDI